MAICIFLLSILQNKTVDVRIDFAEVPGGEYELGYLNNRFNLPHTITVDTFLISSTEITNRQFEEFISATAYITTAERFQNAMVFYPGLDEFEWVEDSTANWKYPNGITRGSIEDKMDHPVATISYYDAIAYCEWAGVRLPTVDEWEIASRGKTNSIFFWGNDTASITTYANIWTALDHRMEDKADKFIYTSPVATYKPNQFGLYDMYGNVFEFCADLPVAFEKTDHIACTRGGSWWCSVNSCSSFNSVFVGRVEKEASFSNQGFRVVKDE